MARGKRTVLLKHRPDGHAFAGVRLRHFLAAQQTTLLRAVPASEEASVFHQPSASFEPTQARVKDAPVKLDVPLRLPALAQQRTQRLDKRHGPGAVIIRARRGEEGNHVRAVEMRAEDGRDLGLPATRRMMLFCPQECVCSRTLM
jgi:hypothetical protein